MMPVVSKDRSVARALLYIPLLLAIGLVPAIIAWIIGSGLAASLDLTVTTGVDWFDKYENRLHNGMIWGVGLGALAGQLPVFSQRLYFWSLPWCQWRHRGRGMVAEVQTWLSGHQGFNIRILIKDYNHTALAG